MSAGLLDGTPPPVDVSTPIFVLRRSFAELQHAVLCIARSAGRLGIPVDAVGMSPREPAIRSRYIRRTLELPPDATDDQWLEALLGFARQSERVLLLPIDDQSALFAEDHRALLAERFLMPETTAGIHRLLESKRELARLCAELGIAAPVSHFPRTAIEALECAEELGYPVVIKRSEWWLTPRDPRAPSVAIVHDPRELLSAHRQMESSVQPQLMVQEYIPGGSDSIWMFNGYFGAGSRCLFGSTGQKLRQRGPHAGPTTLGICAWNQRVVDAATLLAGELGYRGIVDMGFRYDLRDDRYKLLDVNPRVGSSFRLFAAASGLDVVRAAHLDLTGQRVPSERPRDGRKWIVEPYDLVAAAQLSFERSLSGGQWLRSLRGIDEAAWWAPDDRVPFYAMVSSLAPLGVGFRARRRHRRRHATVTVRRRRRVPAGELSG